MEGTGALSVSCVNSNVCENAVPNALSRIPLPMRVLLEI